ncbi:helix-turn-helix transcriptional regulator [bacterium]|nr:helix-turn-helix transcriptional regulator [bacterium]
MMNRKKLLGKRLRELRKKKGYSQEKIAELVNIDPTTISNIENGKNYPSLINLENIINILGISFLDIFDFEHKNSKEDLIDEINNALKQNPEKIEDCYKVIMALIK